MAKRKSTKGQTKHTYKTKDRVTRSPLKPGDELRCSGRVSSSCSTSDTRRVNLITFPTPYISLIGIICSLIPLRGLDDFNGKYMVLER
jgi:hypothetical protein